MKNKREEREKRELLELISEYEQSRIIGSSMYMEEQQFLAIIEHYEAANKWLRALSIIDQALENYPYSTSFHFRKAAILFLINKEAQALTCVENALTLAPKDLELSLLHVELLIFFKRMEEAHAVLHLMKVEALAEELSEILVLEASLLEKQQDFVGAFNLLKESLLHDPKSEIALERLWLCVEQGKLYKKSIAVFKDLIDQHPYSFLAWHKLGHTFAYLGEYEQAVEAYEYAFIIEPAYEDAYFDFAETCFEARFFQKSLDAYKEIAKQFGTDSDLVVRIGECYHKLGQYETARITLEQAARMGPHNDEVFFRIGECYAAQEKWTQACSFFKKAIRMQNDLEEYYTALAEASFELGDFETTEAAYRKTLDIAPDNSQHLLDFAWFLLEMNRSTEALNLLEEGNDFLIEDELTYSYIACLFAGGRRQEAMAKLAEALTENYTRHTCLYDWLPELRKDSEVRGLIALYSPK